MTDTHPVLIQSARNELAEWRREATGSRQSQASYQQTADEHGRDADRADAKVAAIEDALRSVGVEP